MRAIHQFVAGFARGDAISDEVRTLRRVFEGWGHPSAVFCEPRCVLPELRSEARDLGEAAQAVRPDDVVLLHLSIGSAANEAFAALRCRKAILYHNVTPPEWFELVNTQTAATLARGRPQVKALAGAAAVNLADSAFNARELTELGYRDVRVLPIALDFDRLAVPPDPAVLRRYGDGQVNLLFVGRGAPNKKLEDVVSAFHHFRAHVEPRSRLLHVGSFAGCERYRLLLLAQARSLEIPNDRLVLAGSVSQASLNAFYRCASVFVCMSEHEGFCIPLIEAMAHDVPVLAFDATAVPETLAGAGVRFARKDYRFVAEMIGQLVTDKPFREAVLAGQRRRVAAYRTRDIAAELRSHLAPLLA